jgi:proteic killer suppression protein
MHLCFKTKKLAKSANNSREAIKNYGNKSGAKLMQRLKELAAADNLSFISHLPPARCHQLKGSRCKQFSVDLGHPYRLVFEPVNEDCRMDDGSYDLEKITDILIVEIIDYH